MTVLALSFRGGFYNGRKEDRNEEEQCVMPSGKTQSLGLSIRDLWKGGLTMTKKQPLWGLAQLAVISVDIFPATGRM